MQGSWIALRAQFLRQSQTLTFHRRYQALCLAQRALAPFADPRTLLEFCRDPARSEAAKNGVLHALLECVREDSETASVLLALTLWPGLDHVYKQLRSGFREQADAVADELIGAFTFALLKASPATVACVAATLVGNARRDTIRALTQNKRFASCLDPEIETLVDGIHGRVDAHEAIPPGESEVALLDRLRRDFGSGAMLVFQVAVVGLSQREVSDRTGIAYDVTRKRYQRTLRRIRENPPDYLVPRVPIRTPAWHLSSKGVGLTDASPDEANAANERTTRTTARAVSPVGAARDPADRRRVPDRGRR